MRGRKPRVVLSREQRAEVRYMIGQSFFVAQIAKIFEVCDATILKIIKNSRADNLAEDDALVSPLFRSIIAGAKAAATNKFRVRVSPSLGVTQPNLDQIALHGEHEQVSRVPSCRRYFLILTRLSIRREHSHLRGRAHNRL